MRWPTFSRVLRQTARVTGTLAGLAAVTLAGFAAWLYFAFLPQIAEHRALVARLMSGALGQPVTLEAVDGKWQQSRPEFTLEGVTLHDATGRPVLVLPRLDATFSWRSLLALEVRFHHLHLEAPRLEAGRDRDGTLRVAGMPVDAGGEAGGFLPWLMRQGDVQIREATLIWRDAQRQAPDLVVNRISATLERKSGAHRLAFSLNPPPELARPVTGSGIWTTGRKAGLATWAGRISAETRGLRLAALAPWIDSPVIADRGVLAARVNLDFARGEWHAAAAGLDLVGARFTVGAYPPVEVPRMRGQLLWQRKDATQTIAVSQLVHTAPDQITRSLGRLAWAWGDTGRVLTVEGLDITRWMPWLVTLPQLTDAVAQVLPYAPQGEVEQLRLAWSGATPTLDDFEIDAKVRGLGFEAVGAMPGIANFSGRVTGNARVGEFEMASPGLRLDLPDLMRVRQIDFATFKARGRWTREGERLRVVVERAAFENPDFAGMLVGHYDWLPDHPGHADLNLKLTRAAGTAVWRYFPHAVSDDAVEWVRHAVKAGRAESVKARLVGDLARFPFDTGGGEFRVDADIRGATLEYAREWPQIEGIDAHLAFVGKRMEVSSDAARIYGVRLNRVRGVIPDLLHGDEVLEITGQAEGGARDFVRFANFSPVGERLRGLTDALEASGDMRLALGLRVPLRHSRDTAVRGRLALLGGTLYPAGLPRIDATRGEIHFTEDRIEAQNLSARFLGGPLRIDAATRDGRVLLTASGRATAVGLSPWLGTQAGGRLSGETGWRAEVVFDAAGEQVRIESDLVGLASSLPEPLAKPAMQALPLLVTRTPQRGGVTGTARLGQAIDAVWRTDAATGRFDRGEIRFGGKSELPGSPGWMLAGRLEAVDLDSLLAIVPQSRGQDGVRLAGAELVIDTLVWQGRQFADVRIQTRNRNGILHSQLNAKGINGTLVYRPATSQPARLAARFAQLDLPGTAPVTGHQGVSAAPAMRARSFPVFDLVAEDFRLAGKPMGRLDVVARGTPQGLSIETLRITHADSQLEMTGLWREGTPGDTRADLKLVVHDAGRFLARQGFPDTVRRGSVVVSGQGVWPGSPADFSFETLAGTLEFSAAKGQFLRVDPGVGKLLGILSLQALPRRLNFDFRDIFGQGFAFDEMTGTLALSQGVLTSPNFQMRGPAARVTMTGEAQLARESVQLRVKVVPRLSEGVAVAGAILGGPVAGVGALAAQKLLRDPVEEAMSQEFLVYGDWRSPEMKRLPKTANKPDLPDTNSAAPGRDPAS